MVELLVVITIIAIISGVVGVPAYRHVRKAKVSQAEQQIAYFKNALKEYQLDHGTLPTEAQGLTALVQALPGGPSEDEYPEGGYLESREVPLDPWKNAYHYRSPGEDGQPFEVISYGSDGMPGGTSFAQDISSVRL